MILHLFLLIDFCLFENQIWEYYRIVRDYQLELNFFIDWIELVTYMPRNPEILPVSLRHNFKLQLWYCRDFKSIIIITILLHWEGNEFSIPEFAAAQNLVNNKTETRNHKGQRDRALRSETYLSNHVYCLWNPCCNSQTYGCFAFVDKSRHTNRNFKSPLSTQLR